MSRIAYVDHSGRLRTRDVNAGDEVELSDQGMRCTWPVWSPKGDWLAFSAYSASTNGHGPMGMHIVRPDGSEVRLVYSNEYGSGEIAPETPHYASWSPDGEDLAFIAQTLEGGLTLFRYAPGTGGPPQGLVSGGPLYFAWGLGSLIVHSGQSHHLVALSAEHRTRQVPGVSTLYMAPSFSVEDGRLAIFLDAGDDRQRLVVLDPKDESVEIALEVPGKAACVWRPDGSAIGVARDLLGASGLYDGLWLFDTTAREPERIADDPVLAFFWSPDGSHVAYITSSEYAEGSIRWAVLEVSSKETVYLSDFRPTQEQLIAFMFFDQYGQSHPPWSPDGSLLLFAGEVGARTARTPLSPGESNKLYTVATDGSSDAREIAPGFVGCWEPG